MNIESLHTLYKMTSFCYVKNEIKINHARMFSTINVKLQNHTEK